MADDESEVSKASAEPGFPPGSPHQTPLTGAENQSHGEPEAEPSLSISPGIDAHGEGRFPADAQDFEDERGDLDPTPPEPASTPELTSPVPEMAPVHASAPVIEQAKPRSRFPALAATAIAGGILGFSGTFALRHFEGAPMIQTGKSDDRMDALSARVDAIEGKTETAPDASRTALGEIETRVAAAESAATKAAEAANSAQADLQKDIASRPAAQEPTASASNPPEMPDLEPLNTRIGAIEQKLASLETTLATPKAELRARQQERETPAAKQGSHAQTVAIVAQSLLHKLESGGPFSEELAALENLGVAADSLAPLHAASGSAVPNERQLTAQFTALAPAIIEAGAASQAGADEGFLDRVTRHAKGLVHVRRVGEPEGDDTDGLVTRIETALADHDLDAAYTAWKQLPSAAAAKSESWGDAAKARLDAINAAKSIETDAVAVMGKPKS